MLIDTHAHIDGSAYEQDFEEMLQRAKAADVQIIINFGDNLVSSKKSFDLAEKYEEIFAGVGVHPQEVFEMTDADEEFLAKMTESKKIVAIGEIGLDYYREKDAERRDLQKKIFIRQLALARNLHLPVCIHDREAHGDLLQILKTEGKKNFGVIHCFSGSLEMAKELLKMGWLLGIDGPVTYKNAVKALDIVKFLPSDRLLFETDSPYLTPVPKRGHRNEPAFVRYVAEFVAQLREENFEELAKQTSQNAINLYGLK